MTVRLGAATHRGHAELIFERFGPFWGWFSMIDLGIGNFLTLITEFIAIRAASASLEYPVAGDAGHPGPPLYRTDVAPLLDMERLTMAIAAFNLIFIPVALMAHPHWDAVGKALLVWKPLPGGLTKDTLLIVLADIGATVTPWMIFFQQSATVDKGLTRPDIPSVASTPSSEECSRLPRRSQFFWQRHPCSRST